MPEFTPTIREGQLVRGIYSTRPLGRAMADSFMDRDCFGEVLESVYWQHNPSGNDVHTCKGHVRALAVVEEA